MQAVVDPDVLTEIAMGVAETSDLMHVRLIDLQRVNMKATVLSIDRRSVV